MKKITVSMFILLMAISAVACGKKEEAVETVQIMSMDEIDANDVNAKTEDNDVTIDCEYKLDGMTNLTLREVVESGYQFSGYKERDGKFYVLLTPKVEVPGVAAFIDSLNGLTIAE